MRPIGKEGSKLATTKLSTIRQIAITVSDVDVAVAFYHELLGMELSMSQ